MTNSQRLASVRECFRRFLVEQAEMARVELERVEIERAEMPRAGDQAPERAPEQAGDQAPERAGDADPESQNAPTQAAPPAEPAITGESILVRDEFYCGRRFRAEQFHAIWFIEEDQLKIFRRSGQWLQTMSAAEIDAACEDPVVLRMTPSPDVAEAETDRDADQTDHSIRRAA